jgi:hypothetical protein
LFDRIEKFRFADRRPSIFAVKQRSIAPHFPRTMTGFNNAVPDGVSDHAPITVDLPLRDPAPARWGFGSTGFPPISQPGQSSRPETLRLSRTG